MIKPTKPQIRVILEELKRLKDEKIFDLPLPPECIRFLRGCSSEDECREFLESVSIRRAHNILVVLNRRYEVGSSNKS